jgi:hypothetical protein
MERASSASGPAVEATAAILLVTAASDALGFRSASFLLLVLAVPVAAYGGLAALAHVIDLDRGRAHVVLAVALLAFVLFGAAVRSPAVAAPEVPPAATVALVAAFVVVLLQGLAALVERPARTEPAQDVGSNGPLFSFDP